MIVDSGAEEFLLAVVWGAEQNNASGRFDSIGFRSAFAGVTAEDCRSSSPFGLPEGKELALSMDCGV